jgi:hypothetical protein
MVEGNLRIGRSVAAGLFQARIHGTPARFAAA